MNRALLQKALNALEHADWIDDSVVHYEVTDAIEALKTELAKPEPEPEPVGHQFQSRDGTWCDFLNQRHYENAVADGSWPIRAIYAAPTEPNCKFPTCHSQEYQDKLVQEILGQEPAAWGYLDEHSTIVDTLTPEEKAGGSKVWADQYTVPLYRKGK